MAGQFDPQWFLRRPKTVTAAMLLVTVALGLLAALPTLWPGAFAGLLPALKVDTDPENMLREDEPVRLFHTRMKKELSLHDMVVLGVVNDKDPDGVFNPHSLARIYELTEFAKGLRWPEPTHPQERAGVIEPDVIAPSTVDDIEPGGLGVVRFSWLMDRPPTTREEALAVRDRARRIPFLAGTLLSEDGKALCLYLPLSAKDLSYRVYARLREKIAGFTGDDEYYITGLPVAEDTFGVEMFRQMAISAPLAMLVIFLLMLFFFRKLLLIIPAMIVAGASVVVTMALLVITGHTIHIMSSMIPIFLMPIAVLDSVHILSEFHDRYQETRDRRATIVRVMGVLFTPMLYTSLTSAAGFLSLALTPIPPVQVFGAFVALGIMVAWVFTVTFVPASVMFIPQKSLENFGIAQARGAPRTGLSRFLAWTGEATYRFAGVILAATVAVAVFAFFGILRIQVNDNPTKWFTRSHPIRVADRVLNRHFGGTYMAYLCLEAGPDEETVPEYAAGLAERIASRREALKGSLPAAEAVFGALAAQAEALARTAASPKGLDEALGAFVADTLDTVKDPDELDAWDEASALVDGERQRGQVFKQPEALRYVGGLQEELLRTGVVGKSNSLTDIVKTVDRELFEGDPAHFRVPDSPAAVAQCLLTFQSSHRPQDVWHFVTPDYRTTSIWVQLTSGDNRDMRAVAERIDAYMKDPAHRPPFGLKPRWFGLTYINVVWQERMVGGMLQAFLGSFLVVFLMMVLLFRSALWGLLSMIPLTVTIGLIYGVIGWVGKDYDMPVAVLSALTLGLAVDFAIHFLARSRDLYARFGSWRAAVGRVFGEPARAITRNIIVITVGFLPLLAAPLLPYRTVGVLLACILLVSGVATLLILPALVGVLEPLVFPRTRASSLTCSSLTCIVSAAALVAVVVVNVHQFLAVGWTALTWVSMAVLPILAAACGLMAHRQKCRAEAAERAKGEG